VVLLRKSIPQKTNLQTAAELGVMEKTKPMKLTSIVFIICAFFGCSVEHTIDISKIEGITVTFYEDHKLKKSESYVPESPSI